MILADLDNYCEYDGTDEFATVCNYACSGLHSVAIATTAQPAAQDNLEDEDNVLALRFMGRFLIREGGIDIQAGFRQAYLRWWYQQLPTMSPAIVSLSLAIGRQWTLYLNCYLSFFTIGNAWNLFQVGDWLDLSKNELILGKA